MTGFLVELRRSHLRWWFVPLVALALGMILLTGGDWRDSWPRSSAAVTRACLPLMIAALGLTAHRASQLRRGGAQEQLMSRPRVHGEMARLAADITWLCGSYVLSVAIVWSVTWSSAVPGGPWLEYPLFGLTGVAFAASAGYLLGRLLPGRFTGLLAAAAGYPLFLVVLTSSSMAPTVGYQGVDVRLDTIHLIWRAALAGLALLAAVAAVYLVASGRRRPSLALVPVGCLLAGALAMPSGESSELLEPRASARPVCADVVPGSAGGQVCVWPEHAHRLADAVAAAERVHEATADVLPPVERYHEQGLARGGPQGFVLDDGGGSLLDTVAGEHVDRTVPYCEGWQDEHHTAYASVRTWLAAHAQGRTTLPETQTFGDTSYLDEVRDTLRLSDAEQRERARSWAETAWAAPC